MAAFLCPVYTLVMWRPSQRADTHANVFFLLLCDVCTASDGTEESADCTGDSWQYQAADGAWKTEVRFPTNGDESDPNPVSFEEGFLNATGNGEVTVSGISASIATAVSDSFYGRAIRLNLTCNQQSPAIEEEESCVLFEIDFTNFSPNFNVNMALYRFKGKD